MSHWYIEYTLTRAFPLIECYSEQYSDQSKKSTNESDNRIVRNSRYLAIYFLNEVSKEVSNFPGDLYLVFRQINYYAISSDSIYFKFMKEIVIIIFILNKIINLI